MAPDVPSRRPAGADDPVKDPLHAPRLSDRRLAHDPEERSTARDGLDATADPLAESKVLDGDVLGFL
jgi:hypothetical protein